jgi:hypothetical protein
VLDELRADLAERYLNDPALSISEIALAPGFSGGQRLHARLQALDRRGAHAASML